MNKLMLVPESMYNGLLKANEFKDQNNYEFIKSKLSKLKRNKKLSVSAKNVLYNQELRRYLAMRNEERDKPVKVELASGAKILTKPAKNSTVLASSSHGSSPSPVMGSPASSNV